MSQCIEKIGHEECGSRDGLQVFEEDGKYNGYCFACDTYVSDPYKAQPEGYKPEVKERDTGAEINEITHYPYRDLVDRKLTENTLKYFGIKVGVSEVDGLTPVTHHYPYSNELGEVIGYKTRLIKGKKMWCIGTVKNATLFGWCQALASGAKTLYITEGELDAAALFQALKDKNRGTQWADFDPAVVSLTSGASSAGREITRDHQAIRASFKDVVLVFDQDEPGGLATKEALQVIPTARTVTLPAKDPNECIMKGFTRGLCNAVLFKAETPKNTRLVMGSELHEEGRKQPEWGLSWPWEGMTKLTRGMRFGETYYLGAGVKMGKSEMVNTLAAHLMTEHNLKIFMAKPEEANRKTYQMVVGKVAGRIFHDPDREFDYDAYDKASRLVGDRLCMLSLYQHLGWTSLRADILVAVQKGYRAIFIDPITNLVNGVASGETNTILQEIAQELAALAKDLDIMIFIFCHLKAPDGGPAHERGGLVLSHQFSGSRAMMRSCNMMLGLEGNKDPNLDKEIRNVRKLVVLEDREFGASGFVRLYWDDKTGLFNEIREK